jgi:hypothetical protein
MKTLLNTRVSKTWFDEVFSLVIASLFLVCCSVLGVKMLPELPPLNGVVVVSSLILGWLVAGWLTYCLVKSARPPI